MIKANFYEIIKVSFQLLSAFYHLHYILDRSEFLLGQTAFKFFYSNETIVARNCIVECEIFYSTEMFLAKQNSQMLDKHRKKAVTNSAMSEQTPVELKIISQKN